MNSNVAARHDSTHAQYQQQWNEFVGAGFRPISISVYGDRQDPRYASVWARRSGPAFVGIHGATAAGYQAFFDEWAAKGFSPTVLTATGPANDPVYAGVMEQSDHGVSLTRTSLTSGSDLDQATIEYWLRIAIERNWIPRWLSVFGDPGNLRYTLVLDPNPDHVRWAVNGIRGDSAAIYQNVFEAQAAQWAWPALVALTPGGGYVSLFRDGDISPWVARHGQTSAGYQQEINQWWPKGYFPLYVSAGGSPGDTRFASLFVQQETAARRRLTRTGPARSAFAAIDAKIEKHMRDTGTRAIGLAVTRGGRLVHARGFTWSESGYPITQPTTSFRIASCTKPLTSIGVHRLVQRDDIDFDLDEKLLDIMPWSPPPNGGPFAPKVRSITVHHLLTHAGGWNRFVVSDLPTPEMVADSFWVQRPHPPFPDDQQNPWRFPLRLEHIARTQLTAPLQFAPGTDQSYVNVGYLMLGLVIARKTGMSYGDYMRQAVFGPLGLTRPQFARSRPTDQLPGSARQHSNTLALKRTTLEGPVFGDRPFVPLGYGGEDMNMFQSFGGWSMAAVDYAKVLASLERGDRSPVLNQASLDRMWTPSGYGANSSYLDGWDSFRENGGVRVFQHGGSTPGVRTHILYRSDGWGFALFTNSDDNPPDIYPELTAIRAADWPADDLFPQFGIPSF